MKAVLLGQYGAEKLHNTNTDLPLIRNNEVLARVRATSFIGWQKSTVSAGRSSLRRSIEIAPHHQQN